MKPDNTVVPDADLSAMLQLIERQSALIDSQAITIERQAETITKSERIIDDQTKRLDDHASFYRPSRAQQLEELTPINDWKN